MAQINRPTDYFRVKTYTGNSTNNTTITWDETNTNFGTNLLLWLKNRTAAQEHWLTDSIRGGSVFLESNSSNAESDAGGNWGYATNGFVLDDNARTNRNTMVGWGWKAGTSGSNTDGSITSTVSANTTAGFSIVSYTGTGSNATVGHGLSATPKMIIIKRRDAIDSWWVYNEAIGTGGYLVFNSGNASQTTGASGLWNNTSPTSSVFSVGDNTGANGSGASLIAYCFAEKKGFSKCGSYEGNGNVDGTFVYTGFKPAMVFVKNIDATQNWRIFDTKRDPSNDNETNILYPNLTNIESTSDNDIDILSNGFKMRTTSAATNNNTCIYYAVAEKPLVGTNNIPSTAR